MEKLIDSDLQKKPSEVFEIQCSLGKGSYGCVFKARHKKNGITVAAKFVPILDNLSNIVNEISIIQQCKSEYLVQYYGSFYDSPCLWIMMEYCGAGSLSDIMRLLGRTCLEPEIAVIVRGALCGLEYIHQLKKIHRDVKASNILLTEDGCVKLADFWVVEQLSNTLAKRNTVIETPYWMAPEAIQDSKYTSSADIWSLGVTVIEMAVGRPPHADVDAVCTRSLIASEPAPSLSSSSTGEGCARQWSEALVALVAACLEKAPEARPTASGLLQWQFVREAPPALTTLVPAIKAAQELRASSGGGAGTLGGCDSHVIMSTATGLLQDCRFVREAPPASSTLVPVIKTTQDADVSIAVPPYTVSHSGRCDSHVIMSTGLFRCVKEGVSVDSADVNVGSRSALSGLEANLCIICYDELDPAERCGFGSCYQNHVFCFDCLIRWIAVRGSTMRTPENVIEALCPIDRVGNVSLIVRSVPHPAGELIWDYKEIGFVYENMVANLPPAEVEEKWLAMKAALEEVPRTQPLVPNDRCLQCLGPLTAHPCFVGFEFCILAHRFCQGCAVSRRFMQCPIEDWWPLENGDVVVRDRTAYVVDEYRLGLVFFYRDNPAELDLLFGAKYLHNSSIREFQIE